VLVVRAHVIALSAWRRCTRTRTAVAHEHVTFLRALIAARPEASRRALSIAVCDAWGWRQPNGTLCDAVCRGMLLSLHRRGTNRASPTRMIRRVAAWTRLRPQAIELDTSPFATSLRELARSSSAR